MLVRTWFPVALLIVFLTALPGVVVFIADLSGRQAETNAFLEEHFGVSHQPTLPTWASLTLLALPLVVLLLYFLKLRRRPVAVPSTFLWHKSIEDLHVNRLLQWLRKNILLLLQVLALIALIYAILGPRLHGQRVAGKHFILMIDNSASMSCTDVAPNRLEEAKRQALRILDGMSENDVGMVIAFNSTAELRQWYTSDRNLLASAVREIRPTAQQTRLEEALALAEGLANPSRSTENEAVRPTNAEPGKERTYVAAQGTRTEVYLFSDGGFPEVRDFALENLAVEYYRIGTARSADRPDANVGFVRLEAFRQDDRPSDARAVARLRNFGNTAVVVTVELEVSFPGTETPPRLYRQVVELPGFDTQAEESASERRVRFSIPNLDDRNDVLFHARLSGHKDLLAIDDEAWFVLGRGRKARVLLIGEENTALTAFFRSSSTAGFADVVELSAEAFATEATYRAQYLEPARAGEFDLVIFHRCAPRSIDDLPRGNACFFGVPPPPWEIRADQRVAMPSVRGWADRHPLLRNLRGWQEIEIAEAYRPTELPTDIVPLLESDRGLLLMFARIRGPFTDVVMTFPLTQTNGKWNTRWFLSRLFPQFLHRLVHVLGNVRDRSAIEILRPGETKRFRAPPRVERIIVQPPQGSERELKVRSDAAEVLFTETQHPGFYALRWDAESRWFAVNLFDPAESNPEPRDSIRISSESVTASQPQRRPRDLWHGALLIGVFFICLEWWLYNRRVRL